MLVGALDMGSMKASSASLRQKHRKAKSLVRTYFRGQDFVKERIGPSMVGEDAYGSGLDYRPAHL